MVENDAIDKLSAIASRTRMSVFRLLVRQGPDGLSAGEIARRVGVPPTTMSSHLGVLARADIIVSRRESRTVYYALNVSGVRALFGFLLSDCCAGRAELCAPPMAETGPACRE